MRSSCTYSDGGKVVEKSKHTFDDRGSEGGRDLNIVPEKRFDDGGEVTDKFGWRDAGGGRKWRPTPPKGGDSSSEEDGGKEGVSETSSTPPPSGGDSGQPNAGAGGLAREKTIMDAVDRVAGGG